MHHLWILHLWILHLCILTQYIYIYIHIYINIKKDILYLAIYNVISSQIHPQLPQFELRKTPKHLELFHVGDWFFLVSTITASIWCQQVRNAQKLGGIPIFFSEYWMPNVNWFAGGLAVACNEGCNATTYWQPLDRIPLDDREWGEFEWSETSHGWCWYICIYI